MWQMNLYWREPLTVADNWGRRHAERSRILQEQWTMHLLIQNQPIPSTSITEDLELVASSSFLEGDHLKRGG